MKKKWKTTVSEDRQLSFIKVCAYGKRAKFQFISKYSSENITIALYLNSNFPVKKKLNRLYVRPRCLQNRVLSAVHTLELCGTICNVLCGPVDYKNWTNLWHKICYFEISTDISYLYWWEHSKLGLRLIFSSEFLLFTLFQPAVSFFSI